MYRNVWYSPDADEHGHRAHGEQAARAVHGPHVLSLVAPLRARAAPSQGQGVRPDHDQVAHTSRLRPGQRRARLENGLHTLGLELKHLGVSERSQEARGDI